MFKLFEGFTDPFPKGEPQRPPNTLWAFCRHYTRGFEKPLIVMALLSTAIAIIEVSLFGFMGQLVDWLSTSSPDTFLAEKPEHFDWVRLIGIGRYAATDRLLFTADPPIFAR